MKHHPARPPVFRRALAAATLLALAGTAHAQATTALEEIFVTAQKRQQSVQDIGIAISALDGDAIQNMRIFDATGLADFVPSLRVESPGPVNAIFTLRGVGQRDVSPHNEAAVVMFTDNAYVSFIGATTNPLYDLERVEVLKGPQGTLFGRNATGGLVHVLSKRPTENFEAYTRVTVGDYERFGWEGAVSGALAEGVAGRLSLYTNHQDGWIEHYGPDEASNGIENYAGRAQLLLTPSDDLEILLNLRANKYAREGSANAKTEQMVLGADGLPRRPESLAEYQSYCDTSFPAAPLLGYSTVTQLTEFGSCWFSDSGDNVHKSHEIPGYYESEYYGGTATIEWALNDTYTLTSITDYQAFHTDNIGPADATPLPLFYFGQGGDAWQASQELRLSADFERGNWVAGLYYLKIDGDYKSVFGVENNPLFMFNSDARWEQTTESVALFGQGEYELTDAWSIIAGFRWTEDERTLSQPAAQCTPNPLSGLVFGGFGFPDACAFFSTVAMPDGMVFNNYRGKIDQGDWSGKLEIDWKPNFDTLIYASVNRGIKVGGFNANAGQFLPLDQVEYDSETLVSYELGIKSTLLNGSTRINASVFHYDYSDFQTYSIRNGTLSVFNVDAEVDGAEIEIITQPVSGLILQLGASYLDTMQLDVPVPVGGTRDFQMPMSPELTLTGMARYEWGIAIGTLFAQVDATYVDERSGSAIDSTALRFPSYTRTNASAGLSAADESWSMELWVKNLTDEEVLNVNTDFVALTGGTSRFYEAPRMYGATFSYHWR